MSRQVSTAQPNEVISTLSKFPFFKGFDSQLLAQLASVALFRTVSKGDEILTQGQSNSDLFILLKGRLEVLVDGVAVTFLVKPGELIGEMSVISKRPCSATIRAATETEFYVLKADELAAWKGNDQDRIQHLLFKIYSQVLADRLEITNQKAKRIEDMNRQLAEAQAELTLSNHELEKKVEERTASLKQRSIDLTVLNHKLEAQNADMMVSHRKLEELYANRATTMSQLQNLYTHHLIPLDQSLAKVGNGQSEALKSVTETVKAEVKSAVRLLEPITSLYNTELAMRSKRVLLADSNRKQQMHAKLALGGTGVNIEMVETLDEAKEKLEKPFDILFLDSSMLSLADLARAKNPGAKVVLMTSDYIPNYLPDLLKLSTMPNIVSRSDEDRTFTVKNIVTSVTKLTSKDIFGLEKYLAWGVEIREHTVSHSDQRKEFIAAMDEYFDKLGVRRTNRERMGTVAEELLMNAIYDAPLGANGKSLFNHIPRTTPVQLTPEQSGSFRYATDGMFCALSVSDPFGGLSGSTILKYLQSCYGGQAGEMNKEKGGAGRGLHQIVENSDLVVFNLKPGRCTEVIALFNVDPKSNPIQYPTFHLFLA